MSEQTKEKAGFMMSVSDIMDTNKPQPPIGKSPKDFDTKDFIGSGPIGNIINRLESDEVKEHLGKKDAPKEDEKTKPKGEDGEKPKPPTVTREAKPPPVKQAAETKPAPSLDRLPKQQSSEDKEIYDSLEDSQRAELDFLKNAETVNPNLKGAYSETIEYYKKVDAQIVKMKKEDPDVDLNEDEDFKGFLDKNRPNFSDSDINQAKESILISKTKDEVSKKYDDRLNRMEKEPIVKEKTSKFQADVFSNISDTEDADLKEILDVMSGAGGGEEGVTAAKEQFPEETGVVMKVYDRSNKVGEALISLREGLDKYDKSNEVHREAGQQVMRYEDAMTDSKNEEHRKKDGKLFLPAHEFYALPDAERAQHWTFSTEQLLKFMAEDARRDAEKELTSERERLTKIAERVAKRAGVKLPEKDKDAKADKDVREEAGDSAKVAPSRATEGASKTGDSDKKHSLAFMMSGDTG